MRISHLLSQNLASSQVPQQLFFKQVQIAITQKTSEQQLAAHSSIVKGKYDKVLQTCSLLFKRTIVLTGVTKLTGILHKILNK